jgi:hypothetical protein
MTDTLLKCRYTFMVMFRWILLAMTNVSDQSCRESQNTNFILNNFFFRTSCHLWDNIKKKSGRAIEATDDSIRRMRFAYRLIKATVRHPEYVILFFHGNSGYADAHRCYDIRTLPVLLCISCPSGWGVGCLMQMCITGKNIHSLTYPSSVCWHVCYRSAVSSRNSTFGLRDASFLFLECQKLENWHRLLAFWFVRPFCYVTAVSACQ